MKTNSLRPHESAARYAAGVVLAVVVVRMLPMGGGSKKRSVGSNPVARRRNNLNFLEKFCTLFSICVPSFFSTEAMYLWLLTGLLVIRSMISVYNVRLGALTATHFVSRRWSGLRRCIQEFALLSLPAAVVNAFLKYTQDVVALKMRKNLSTHVNQLFLSNENFYKATQFPPRLDHPERVLTAAVEQYCDQVAKIYCHCIKPCMDVTTYTVSLAKTVGWQGPGIIWMYFVIRHQLGSWLDGMRSGSDLKTTREMLHTDAHKNLLADADEIAINGCAHRDQSVISWLLDSATESTGSKKAHLALVSAMDTLLLKYGASVAGYAVLLSPYLLGMSHVRNKTTTVMIRDYIVILKSLTELNRGIMEMEEGFKMICGVEDSTIKVAELIDSVTDRSRGKYLASPFDDGRADKEPIPEMSEQWLASWRSLSEGIRDKKIRLYVRKAARTSDVTTDNLEFQSVDVQTPDGALLVSNICFAQTVGQNLLITGRHLCGKTAILRTLGDLWSPAKGVILKPPAHDIMYVAEKPHLVFGTLRDQIIYPHTQQDQAVLGVTDVHLAQLLCLTDLRQTEAFAYVTCRKLGISVVTATRSPENVARWHSQVITIERGTCVKHNIRQE
eukprot:gene2204-3396_t